MNMVNPLTCRVWSLCRCDSEA